MAKDKSLPPEVKLLLMVLLALCTLATLPFIPSSYLISTSEHRFCISSITGSNTVNSNSIITVNSTSVITVVEKPVVLDNGVTNSALIDEQMLHSVGSDLSFTDEPTNGVIKRTFSGHGWAAYNFVLMSAYRGGVNTFAVIGLSSKPLHVYARPTYLCEWVPLNQSDNRIQTNGTKMLTDWGYGRVYTTVVVNCTFPESINPKNTGGSLLLHATTGDTDRNITDSIQVLTESPNTVDFDLYSSKEKYDYLYCGSSLFGDLSPQRIREWIAYHVRFFGKRSHFVLHDAGGVSDEVLEVLKPWIELGKVTLQDIRDQERFDGYYHNQFMVVNDCLHRYRFMTKWMFFFDVDEFIHIPARKKKNKLSSVMKSLEGYSQFTIEQMPMSSQICFSGDGPDRTYRNWGIEKLAYRDVKKATRRTRDRKYAVQPRNLFATGVHMSQHLQGKTTHKTEGKISYFHYHGSIAQRSEPCRHLYNDTRIVHDNNPYVLDTTMRKTGLAVKTFEIRMIGDRLLRTRQ